MLKHSWTFMISLFRIIISLLPLPRPPFIDTHRPKMKKWPSMVTWKSYARRLVSILKIYFLNYYSKYGAGTRQAGHHQHDKHWDATKILLKRFFNNGWVQTFFDEIQKIKFRKKIIRYVETSKMKFYFFIFSGSSR